ncbi:hypothetical protein DITRI_Ditri05aG0113600 [Diplodiscus trichospermus]
MGLNHNLEAKKGPATVFPAKKTLVKRKMFDQMVQCVASCCGRCPHCNSSGTSQSSKSEVSTEEVVKQLKTEK